MPALHSTADPVVRSVHPSTGDPVARTLVANALAAATDGATIMATGLPYAGSGIVVAIPEHGWILEQASHPFLADRIREWVHLVAPVVTATSLRPRAFGVWYNDEDDAIYLDVVEIFPADQEADAVAAGRARCQIAIWHAGRGVEIPTSEVSADTCDRCDADLTERHHEKWCRLFAL